MGWRAAASEADCLEHEFWQATQPPPPDTAKADRIAAIKLELLAVDAKTPRAVRESTLTGDTSRLVDLEAQAVKLRAELATLT
ncbi:hypothetical protein DEH84_07095 [Aquabacterium olei]|uniref:Uncharacterized protein n=1 Tax=Aquabacterium olei TaxID=1296669 RepID=A0A2U8FQ84_9BURK|nr:hypothetical protein [Aquabacterium olei]AWI53222.1 hypothetical protein DEH84_07095 [Aquabacterium olei]